MPFVTWLNEWLSDYRDGFPRDITLAFLRGARRSGKTFAGVAAVVAMALDCPVAADGTPLIAWLVCKSYREMYEVQSWIRNRLPADWFHELGAPIFEFHLTNGKGGAGAVIRLLSADDDDATKQGRVDIAFINEPQKMGARAIANCVLGAADLGGLVILGANRPRANDSRGEWMFDLVEAVEDEAITNALGKRGESLGVKVFDVDPKKNKSIDQIARRRAGRLATVIDKSLASDDEDDGKWRRSGEKAFWEFDKHRHLHACPEVAPGLPDITREVGRERGEWGDWQYIAGVDFDWRPHIVCVIYRVFGTIDDPTFWAVGEFAGEKRWTTQQWIEAFGDWGEGRGFTPSSLLFIGDASSSWPGRKDDPKVEEGRTSFETIEGAGWTIIPPQDHRGKTGKARNPFVDERLDLYNELLRRDRIRIDPVKCSWLAQCAREATTERKTGRRKLVHNQFAHAIDASSYPPWRLAARPGEKRVSGPPMVTISVTRGQDPY